MFLGIPGLCVVAATHLLDPGEMLLRCCGYIRDPVLFVENKSLYPVPLAVQRDGRLGEFRVRASENCFPTLHLSLTQFQPADATLICYGGSVLLAMEAALTLLVKHEISCDVVIPTLLSPVPSQEICSFLGSSRHVLSLEESPVQGGWGSEILASLVERGGPAQRTYTRIGASFSPLPAGKTLEAHLLPSVSGIVATIRGRRGV
jgi:pyruvate/2-oxoglutarate/acetoin dehydrogenase E1 component